MKRHMTNEKNKTDADWEMSKKQKSDTASNKLQEQASSDHYTNEAAERKETLLDEENLETDGEKALFTKGQCQKSDDGRRQILKPGFGFDQKTKIFRRDCNEKSSTNQSVKTRSVGVNLKQGVEGTSTRVAEQNQTTKDLPGKESATNMKKLEPNQDETNKTNKKPIAKIANNSNTNPEIPEPHQNETNKTHTKPVAKIANNSTTKPETLEMDVIYTRKLQEWTLPKAPKQVLSSYEDMSPKKLPCEHGAKVCGIPLNRKKPDQKTNILIPHKYADKPEGDDFGAILYTYKEHMEYGGIYYRHFFGKVIPGQPASEMKIEEDDELVLLNDVFVPKLKHTDVLNLFHHDVKVDGKTRFSLVIRRKREEKWKWKWIETSAILAPEKQTDTPAVTKRRYNEEPGDKVIYLPASKHLYKAHGSNKYIDVCDGEVRMDTMKTGDNRTKILWKHPKFWQVGTEGHVDFATTLSDITKKWYIEMNDKKIVVDREPFWFKMINVGSTIRFQYQNLYLGYNLDNDELQAQVSNCTFEEFPASSVDKADDVSSKHEAETDLDNSGKISGTLHLNITSPETCRYPEKNSDFSSHTLSSADSGASGFGFTRSCSSVSDNSDHLSVTSESSGYRTSTPEDMDINSPQETCPKFPTRGFPWSSHLAPVDTPTTPLKNMALSEVD